MTSFWWLQRGWCETECKDCGANIKASGGDPDWGRCSGCFDRHVAGKEAERMHEAKMVEQHAAQIRSMHEAVLIGEMRGRVQAAFDDVARAKQQADDGSQRRNELAMRETALGEVLQMVDELLGRLG